MAFLSQGRGCKGEETIEWAGEGMPLGAGQMGAGGSVPWLSPLGEDSGGTFCRSPRGSVGLCLHPPQ